MSLISQLTSHYFYSKVRYYQSPSCAPSVQRLPEVCSQRRRYSVKAKPSIRVRSEFDAKVNGVLPSDSDPRFLDRVCFLSRACLLSSGILIFACAYLLLCVSSEVLWFFVSVLRFCILHFKNCFSKKHWKQQ